MRRLLFLLIIGGCSPSEQEKLHAQSVEIHDLAIETGKQVDEQIQRIVQYANEVEEPMKSFLLDSVESLKEDFVYWQSTIVEVPGHEHEHHDHDHGDHKHDHSSSPDLTPKMVLDIQRDLNDRVVKLNNRVKKVLDKVETVEGT